VPHALNYVAGWWLVLAGFASGAIVGLKFHQPDFLGGYASLRRRLLRLGHIALVALGMLNIVYGLSPGPAAGGPMAGAPGALLLAGAMAMPLVCFLSAWRTPFRQLFFIPVVLLVAAGIGIIAMRPS
jgi:hypothetical protein